MCRSKNHPGGAKRCAGASDPSARNARRRARYAERKNENSNKVAGDTVTTTTVSENAFFTKSMARDADGNLIKMYHCSEVDFTDFDPAFTGSGNDQYGSGFYFNPDLEISKAYGEFTHEVHLNIENPMVIKDGNMNDVTLDKKAVRQILKAHPDAYVQPENDEDRYSLLSDYSSKFWDKTEWSKPEMDRMLDDMADEYFSNEGNYNNVELLFDESSHVFRQKVHETTGYDGVIADLGEHGKHYIAWFPEQIQRIPKKD